MTSLTSGEDSVYNRVRYPGYAYPQTHPDRLATLGRLFGLSPTPVDRCRVLELGCGEGGNLLAMAASLPGSQFVGVDAAERPVAHGNALLRAAGLENARLLVADIERLPELGAFDYVIAHGVYSWVPPATRGALLEVCRRMSPNGLAYVSYNAYPGSHLRDMAREILEYHLRGVTDADARLHAAQELMRQIVASETPTPFARVLREQLQRLLQYSDFLLLHDDLAEVSTPFYFHEFMEHAQNHGLQFLSEAELSDSTLPEIPTGLAALLSALPPDVVVREQYLDFVTNRMFRQTVLCAAEASVNRRLDPAVLSDMIISCEAQAGEPDANGARRFHTPRGASLTTASPPVIAAVTHLISRWPAGVPFADLRTRLAGEAGRGLEPREERELQSVLLEAHVASVVGLSTYEQPIAPAPGARPRSSPLVRAQLAGGATSVVSLRHTNVSVGEAPAGRLLALLDGSRDRDALSRELATAAGEHPDPDVLEQQLDGFARAALLQG